MNPFESTEKFNDLHELEGVELPPSTALQQQQQQQQQTYSQIMLSSQNQNLPVSVREYLLQQDSSARRANLLQQNTVSIPKNSGHIMHASNINSQQENYESQLPQVARARGEDNSTSPQKVYFRLPPESLHTSEEVRESPQARTRALKANLRRGIRSNSSNNNSGGNQQQQQAQFSTEKKSGRIQQFANNSSSAYQSVKRNADGGHNINSSSNNNNNNFRSTTHSNNLDALASNGTLFTAQLTESERLETKDFAVRPVNQFLSGVSPGGVQQLNSQHQYQHQQQTEQYLEALKRTNGRVSELEESLRIEMLNSEEQRVYIDILKRALEQKLEEGSFANFLSQMAREARVNKVDIVVQYEKMRALVMQQSINAQQFRELNQLLAHLQRENQHLKDQNREVLRFNENMNNELQNAIEALTVAQRETVQYQQEKERLNDELTEAQLVNGNTEFELRQLKGKNEDLQRGQERTARELEEARNRVQQAEQRCERLSSETAAFQLAFQELKQHNSQLSEVTEKYRRQLEEKVEIFERTRQQNENMKHQHEESVSELVTQLQSSQELLEQLTRDKRYLQAQVETLQEQIDEQQGQGVGEELRHELEQLNEIVEDYRSRLEQEREGKSAELKTLYEQLSTVRSENRTLKEESARLHGAEDEAQQCRSMLEKQQTALLNLTRDNALLREEATARQVNLQGTLDALRARCESQEEQLHTFERLNDEYRDKLRSTNGEREQLAQKAKDTLEHERHSVWQRARTYLGEVYQRCEFLLPGGTVTEGVQQAQQEEGIFRQLCLGLEKQIKSQLQEQFEKTQREKDEREMAAARMAREQQQRASENATRAEEDRRTAILTLQSEREIALQELQKARAEASKIAAESDLRLVEAEKLKVQIGVMQGECQKIKSESERVIEKLKIDNEKLKNENERLTDKFNNLVTEQQAAAAFTEKLALFQSTGNDEELQTQIAAIRGEMFDKLRVFVWNPEALQIVEEFGQVAQNCAQLSAQKNELVQNVQTCVSLQQQQGNTAGVRKKLEEVKNRLSEVESRLKISLGRKEFLALELKEMEALEGQRQQNTLKSEKMSQYLKSELQQLKSELELKQLSHAGVEQAYQDLLRDYKRLTQEQKRAASGDKKKIVNSSFTQQQQQTQALQSVQNQPAINISIQNKNKASPFDSKTRAHTENERSVEQKNHFRKSQEKELPVPHTPQRQGEILASAGRILNSSGNKSLSFSKTSPIKPFN